MIHGEVGGGGKLLMVGLVSVCHGVVKEVKGLVVCEELDLGEYSISIDT